MKWRVMLAVLSTAAIWAGILPAVSVETALVGTWQLKSFSLIVVDTKETSRPYGENPTGYIQFSPGGHMVMFLAAGELKPPAAGHYTDADRADVHRAIVGAYAAAYTVEGNTVTYHVLTSWRPEWIGKGSNSLLRGQRDKPDNQNDARYIFANRAIHCRNVDI